MVSLERDGRPVRFLLDMREVACGHTGVVLARDMHEMLETYGIVEKVSFQWSIMRDTNLPMSQMLAITVDNASNNNSMVAALATAIPTFPGSPNHVRCFAHIINLVAKTLIRQFDTTKNTKGASSDEDAAAVLADLVAGLDGEDTEMPDEEVTEGSEGGEGGEDDDDVDGWIDERTDLTEQEREELRETVLPVKLILAKV